MSDDTLFAILDALPFGMLGALAVLLFSGLPVAVVLFGLGTLFSVIGWLLGEMPTAAFFLIPGKLLSALNGSLFYPAVVMLLFMGVALEKSGIAHDMLRALRLATRRAPGGLAISVLLIGVLLAPAAGVVGASVVTLTLIALPAMLRAGYSPEAASGAVAAAGTVGIILPPAVMLFFLAGEFQVPLGSMFMATVMPGALLLTLYALWYMASARPDPAAPLAEAPRGALAWAGLLLRGLLAPAALVALVLGSIILGWATPSQSGALGAAGALLLTALTGRLRWRLFVDLVETTARLSAMVFLIIIAAAVFSYPFRYFGGDTAVADALAALGLGPWPALLLITGIVFVLGFFIDWIEITIITLPLFFPVLAALDFAGHAPQGVTTLLWMAAIMALTLQTSFLTPPFGFALFFLKGAAPPGVGLGAIYRGIAPILAIQISVIALALAWPPLVLWLPEQTYGALR
ncbi:MAG: TRAP transporter large permease subunit [Pseudomonadota bacterium]